MNALVAMVGLTTMATRKKAKVTQGDQDPKRLALKLRSLANEIHDPGPYEDLWYVLRAFANAIEGNEYRGETRPAGLRDAIAKCRKYCREAPDHSGTCGNRDPIAIPPKTKPEAYSEALNDLEWCHRGGPIGLRGILGSLQYLVGLIDANLLRDNETVERWLDECENAAKARKVWSTMDIVDESLRLAGVSAKAIETIHDTHDKKSS